MASEQQLNLRWSNFTNNMMQVFLEQFKSEHLVDCTLSSQGQFLKAHKIVLSACSPYFKNLFKNHVSASNPVIIFSGINFLDLKLVVEFMYQGEIKVLESELEGLLAAAEVLQVKGLSNVRDKYDKGEVQGDPPVVTEVLIPKAEVQEPQESGGYHATSASPDPLQGSDEDDAPAAYEDVKSADLTQTCGQPSTATAAETLLGDNTICPEAVKLEAPEFVEFTASGTFSNDDEDEGDIAGWETPNIVVDMQCDVSNAANAKPSHKVYKTLRKRVDSRPYATRAKVLRSYKCDSEGDDESGAETTRQKPRPSELLDKHGCKIPRPPNAFMIFANEWRSKLASKYPGQTNKDISVRLGIMWKSLDQSTKEAYYKSSRLADLEHKRKYPGYYYSPKEARLRKFMKHNNRHPSANKPDSKQLCTFIGGVFGRSGRWKCVGGKTEVKEEKVQAGPDQGACP